MWDKVGPIIDYWGGDHHTEDDYDRFVAAAGPSGGPGGGGHFNDPDMILVGNSPYPNPSPGAFAGACKFNHGCDDGNGCTAPYVSKTQPGVGCMDCGSLSHTEEQTQFGLWAIFAAPLLMSVDLRTVSNASREILLNDEIISVNQDRLGRQGRRLVGGAGQVWSRPLSDGVAVALYNKNASAPLDIAFSMAMVGFSAVTRVSVRDLYAHADEGVFVGRYVGRAVPLHGIKMLKLTLAA